MARPSWVTASPRDQAVGLHRPRSAHQWSRNWRSKAGEGSLCQGKRKTVRSSSTMPVRATRANSSRSSSVGRRSSRCASRFADRTAARDGRGCAQLRRANRRSSGAFGHLNLRRRRVPGGRAHLLARHAATCPMASPRAAATGPTDGLPPDTRLPARRLLRGRRLPARRAAPRPTRGCLPAGFSAGGGYWADRWLPARHAATCPMASPRAAATCPTRGSSPDTRLPARRLLRGRRLLGRPMASRPTRGYLPDARFPARHAATCPTRGLSRSLRP